MTDDKIIKALECCLTGGKCSNCMYNVHNAVCVENLIKDAHSLISRQKAEIERLNFENLQMIASIKNVEAEAVKDFAERLKRNEGRRGVPIGTIDNLLKEMGVG